jgi:hypothetical protein
LFESLYYEHPNFKELLTDDVVESFLKDVLEVKATAMPMRDIFSLHSALRMV